MKPYKLIRQKDSQPVFAATYAKHFRDGDYCALMEEYPSDNTRVLLCRKVSENEKGYGFRLCRLISHGTNREEKVIGYYVSMCETRSEQEAQDKLKANLSGNDLIASVLKKT